MAQEFQEGGASRARRRARGIGSEHARVVRERVAEAKGIEIVRRRMVQSVAFASPGYDALRRLQKQKQRERFASRTA